MPVIFFGHGSPMNAIEENEFVDGFRIISKQIPKPKAILCVSAHWLTRGTFVTAMEYPPTIHDFGGFPKALFEVQYPAPGAPELAKEICERVQSFPIHLDFDWGLDHGTWSVLKHTYPNAEIPVLQMSIDVNLSPDEHFRLGKELAKFREEGVLVIGSGNIVHNLGLVDWSRLRDSFAFAWAKEMNDQVKDWIQSNDFSPLIHFYEQSEIFRKGIPTPEHFLPLLYILGAKLESDQIVFFNDAPVGGALTMTSVLFTTHYA
ncbi:4,5-DOPA dioxygenase extradiol [Leptospira ryugenii]|nr:4,5-DOPA dioxygenase extradiol [Leptospira ryugenii]